LLIEIWLVIFSLPSWEEKFCCVASVNTQQVWTQNFVALHRMIRNKSAPGLTGDESWCFVYDPETKCQSETWLSPKKLKTQKLRMQKSLVKTMLPAYFDAKGIIHHEFVPKKQIVMVNVIKR
jgi:hypothetical protein